METYSEEVILQPKQNTKVKIMIIVLISMLLVLSLSILEINLVTMFLALPQFLSFFFKKFLPPSFNSLLSYVLPTYMTLLSAVVGTYISTLFAFILALLMAKRTNPIEPLRLFVRGFVSFLRNIPILVWASVLIYIFGVGSFVGLVALVIATLGFLSRSYADSIDALPQECFEAIEASGASYCQIIWHALIPSFLKSWLSWTLYIFEINVRASIILGMVGAGGIGVLIQTNLRLFKYQEAMTIILIVIALVLIIEFSTNKIRKVLN